MSESTQPPLTRSEYGQAFLILGAAARLCDWQEQLIAELADVLGESKQDGHYPRCCDVVINANHDDPAVLLDELLQRFGIPSQPAA